MRAKRGAPALATIAAFALAPACAVRASAAEYAWLAAYDSAQAIDRRIAAPEGCARVVAAEGSFGAWLRGLPLKEGRPPVHLHDGRRKRNQEAHWAVVDIDTGRKNLQQCADAVLRLRAEYLFSRGEAGAIDFRFTSGDRAPFVRWAAGERPVVRGQRVSWTRSASEDAGYASFRRYLDVLFTYAGSASLARDLAEPREPRGVAVGDVFVQGGFPGHAVIVVDACTHARTGRTSFLLAQSYMPAQEIHVLRRPSSLAHPWYEADEGDTLETPEWTFRWTDRRRFEWRDAS